MGDRLKNLLDGGSEPGKVTDRLEPMNRATVRTAQAPEINGLRQAGKIGQYKTMPP